MRRSGRADGRQRGPSGPAAAFPLAQSGRAGAACHAKEYAHLPGAAERLRATEAENTLFALENLQTYPCVQARLADGSLRVHGWFFKIATAELFAYDPASNQFEPLGGVGPPNA